MSAQIAYQENDLVLTIPKAMMDEVLMRNIVEWVEFTNLTEQNRMNIEDAWVLSEEMKEQWWVENGQKILAKLGL